MVLAFFEKRLDGCPRSRVAELRTFSIMLHNGIAQFLGSWVSESGYHLRIKKVREDRASVDFPDPRGGVSRNPGNLWTNPDLTCQHADPATFRIRATAKALPRKRY